MVGFHFSNTIDLYEKNVRCSSLLEHLHDCDGESWRCLSRGLVLADELRYETVCFRSDHTEPYTHDGEDFTFDSTRKWISHGEFLLCRSQRKYTLF